jgi:hypothetical protein
MFEFYFKPSNDDRLPYVPPIGLFNASDIISWTAEAEVVRLG